MPFLGPLFYEGSKQSSQFKCLQGAGSQDNQKIQVRRRTVANDKAHSIAQQPEVAVSQQLPGAVMGEGGLCVVMLSHFSPQGKNKQTNKQQSRFLYEIFQFSNVGN